MLAAVHRWGGVGVKKSRCIHDENTIFTHRQYIRIYSPKSSVRIFIAMKYLTLLTLLLINWACNSNVDEPFTLAKLDVANNLVLNGTNKTYLDTIIYVGLKEIEVNGVVVAINNMSLAPKTIDGNPLEAYVSQLNDNTFALYVKNDLRKSEAILILSHELIHIKQYYSKQLQINQGEGTVEWNGAIIYNPGNIDYIERPWEIDAFLNERRLSSQIEDVVYN